MGAPPGAPSDGEADLLNSPSLGCLYTHLRLLTAGASLSFRGNCQFLPQGWGLILRAQQVTTEQSHLPGSGLLLLYVSTLVHTCDHQCLESYRPALFPERRASGSFQSSTALGFSSLGQKPRPFTHAFIHGRPAGAEPCGGDSFLSGVLNEVSTPALRSWQPAMGNTCLLDVCPQWPGP